ncbi:MULTISPECIES: GMC family oxidoreductase N-terminal domain-containing protein [unclassified Chelatococcus]|uniref:GMC family oxidoreductase n=1 Tax=unclassified Chelatococcus TaxID=2638111 RepID=UPI001BCDE946|nr:MULTISPECIES: GMC family oxidoreductase N-terminal domain-containing protein [unclassified Chelatococcus]MBS7701537.1 GMC family oxidoreductase N-terminal domain-containing protein [Chelatococcus sp. YT9]MBX3557372.1 GMC family oxidoreductase N-terminal domain-containing protein [Chelatococcus sp.]
MAEFDYLIVGAGAAGCVVAARLSANPKVRVLLLEAGMDLLPGQEPASVRNPFPSASSNPDFGWKNLLAEVGPDVGNGRPVYTRLYSQGRVMGGSSTINGMMAQRGLPADYDEWERLGAEGWGWDSVLPYFNRLETDTDFRSPMHGNDGPIPIRRAPRSSWPPFGEAFAQEAQAAGYEFHEDMNAYFGDCVSAVPLSNTATDRISAANGYLTAEVRRRPNLTILTDTYAETLLLSGSTVTGVKATKNETSEIHRARETILCAGAIQSPALMLRSGIGPSESLRRVGIVAVVDRAGVGQNLNNHPGIHVAVHLPRSSKHDVSRTTCWATSILRYSSGVQDCPPGDMQIFSSSRTSWHPLGWRIGALTLLVYKPFSLGSVELKSADPNAAPLVRNRLLSDKRDLERMIDGLKRVASILASPRVRKVANEAFMPPGGRANKLNTPSFMNWLKSGVINLLFDVPFGGLRRFLLRRQLVDLETLIRDKAAREDLILKHSAAVHHVSGTCKMGGKEDPMAVVDSDGKVYGVANLRVADASIMPTVISANTHLPVLMIGEKISQSILDEIGKSDKLRPATAGKQ